MKKIVRVGSVDVTYSVEGNGPGLLLIHGTGGTYENTWGDMIKSLAGSYTIVSPNYSGSGETLDSGEKLQLDDLVEQNIQAVLQEGINEFHIVGYSLGAEIAAAIAAKYPKQVKSATLIAGWVESDLASAFQFALWQKLFHIDRRLFAQFLMYSGFSPNFYNQFNNLEELDQMSNQFAGMLAKGTDRQSELDSRINIRPLLNRIVAPVLVIGLTYDRMVPIENARELASLIKGAEYREIPSGHLVPWEKSETLIDEVSRFVTLNL
ncbi:alpha/beta fold hydrolase [Bacillus changyiensis]|uniref:alpha/beta fold hydrolase n=1 Tax=Bacillus changyiensis TaxID=3004103 RepID=UPI0022E969D8|nr:alpha/beta hydrolase [Bacillus changyiensis]MDA1478087.1 alpha/beta hydrolase [Bacillus changyiensis]